MGHHRPKTPRLGEKLRQIRKTIDGGLTQNELVERLGLERDFDQERVSKYERGVLEPPIYVLVAYCDLAKISLDVLCRPEYDVPGKLPALSKNSDALHMTKKKK
jgi:transcriptional regulator with XRE-family HTH domain